MSFLTKNLESGVTRRLTETTVIVTGILLGFLG